MPVQSVRKPRVIPGFSAEQSAALFAAFAPIDDAIDDLGSGDGAVRVHTSTVNARARQFLRVSPQTSAGMAVVLPPPESTAPGDRVTISLEAPGGPLRVVCSPNQSGGRRQRVGLVNGQERATFTTAGIIELVSNGATGYTTPAEHPAESAATPGITPIASTEVQPENVSGSRWRWVLRPFSVVLGRLARQTGLSVLGRASAALGEVELISSGGARRVLASDSSNAALAFRALELADLPTLPTPGWDDVLAEDNASGANDVQIDAGQHLNFGAAGPTTSNPQIRSGDAIFRVRAAGVLSMGAVDGAVLFSDGAGLSLAADDGVLQLQTALTTRLNIQQNGAWSLGGTDTGTSGEVLTSQGASSPPVWAAVDLSSVTYTAGDGIDLASNTFSADVSDFAGSGLEDDGSNNLRIAASAAGNGLTGGGGSALAVGGSTSIIVGANDVQRAALTGEVTASQDSNATTITRSTNFQSSPWTGSHQFNAALVSGGVFSHTVSAGVADNLSIGAVTCVRIDPTGVSDVLRGLVASFDGQLVWVENIDSTVGITIENDASSTAANGIYIPQTVSSTTLFLPPRTGIWLRYNGTLQRWITADTKSFFGLTINDVDAVSTVGGIAQLRLEAGSNTTWETSSPSTGTRTLIVNVSENPTFETVLISEQSSSPSVSSGDGMLWVRSETPCQLVFTDDANNDRPVQNAQLNKTTAQVISAATTVLDTTGTYTIPANTLQVGSCFRVEYWVRFVRGGTATAMNVDVFVDFAGDALTTANAVRTVSGTYYIHVVGIVTVLTTGASGTAVGSFTAIGSALNLVDDMRMAQTHDLVLAVNTTIANTVRGAARMNTAVAGTTLTALGGYVQWLR